MSAFDQITKFEDGTRIYQGSELAPQKAKKLTEPYVVVSMVGALDEIFDGHLVPVLAVFIEDHPTKDDMETIPDKKLLSMVDACISFIKNKNSIVIHCHAGKHRSTYFDAALHMQVMGLSYEEAFKWIKDHHPEAEGRKSGEAQLRRMYDAGSFMGGKNG